MYQHILGYPENIFSGIQKTYPDYWQKNMHLIYLQEKDNVFEVRKEIHSKGFVYAAEDCRGQLLVISQRVRFLRDIIDWEIGEHVSEASLFECASGQLKGGQTKSFRVCKMGCADVPLYLQRVRERRTFGKVVLAATNSAKWMVQRDESDESRITG